MIQIHSACGVAILSRVGVALAQQRLEDKIRTLSERAVAVKDPDKLHCILHELRAALKELVQRVRDRAVRVPPPPVAPAMFNLNSHGGSLPMLAKYGLRGLIPFSGRWPPQKSSCKHGL